MAYTSCRKDENAPAFPIRITLPAVCPHAKSGLEEEETTLSFSLTRFLEKEQYAGSSTRQR
jgi:hypothetical protein